jgi:hypothetical protein
MRWRSRGLPLMQLFEAHRLSQQKELTRLYVSCTANPIADLRNSFDFAAKYITCLGTVGPSSSCRDDARSAQQSSQHPTALTPAHTSAGTAAAGAVVTGATGSDDECFISDESSLSSDSDDADDDSAEVAGLNQRLARLVVGSPSCSRLGGNGSMSSVLARFDMPTVDLRRLDLPMLQEVPLVQAQALFGQLLAVEKDDHDDEEDANDSARAPPRPPSSSSAEGSSFSAGVKPWPSTRPQGLQLTAVECLHNTLQLAQLASQLSLLEDDVELLHGAVQPVADIGTATSAHNKLVAGPLATRAPSRLPPAAFRVQQHAAAAAPDLTSLCCKLPAAACLPKTMRPFDLGPLHGSEAGGVPSSVRTVRIDVIALPAPDMVGCMLGWLPAAASSCKTAQRPRLPQLRPDPTLYLLTQEMTPALHAEFLLPQLQRRSVADAESHRLRQNAALTLKDLDNRDAFLQQFSASLSLSLGAPAETVQQQNLARMRAFRPRTQKAKVSSAQSSARPAKLMRRAPDNDDMDKALVSAGPAVAARTMLYSSFQSPTSSLPVVVAPKSQSDLVRHFMGLKKASGVSQKFGQTYNAARALRVLGGSPTGESVVAAAMAPPRAPDHVNFALHNSHNDDKGFKRAAHRDRDEDAYSPARPDGNTAGYDHRSSLLQPEASRKPHRDAQQYSSQLDQGKLTLPQFREKFSYSPDGDNDHSSNPYAPKADRTPRKTAQQTIRGFCTTIADAVKNYVTLLHTAGIIESRDTTVLFGELRDCNNRNSHRVQYGAWKLMLRVARCLARVHANVVAGADQVAHLKQAVSATPRPPPKALEAAHVLLVAAELSHCVSGTYWLS